MIYPEADFVDYKQFGGISVLLTSIQHQTSSMLRTIFLYGNTHCCMNSEEKA
jgi:hypothetical protein